MVSCRFCNRDEKRATVSLYEEAFPQDEKVFVDAFYKYEVPHNRVAGAFKDGILQSMMHLHPMRLRGGALEVETVYIVAVATYRACRKRGLYRQLLRWTMNKLYGESMPFVLLMPANERIYYPFGFRTQIEMGRRRVTKPQASELIFEEMQIIDAADLDRMNAYAAGRLHIARDADWSLRTLGTYPAMKGGIVRVHRGDVIVGYLRYTAEDALHVVDLLAEPADEEEILRAFAADRGVEAMTFDMARVVGDEPTNDILKYMFRIVDLAAFTNLLYADRMVDWTLRVDDALIAENNGTWRFYTENGKVRMQSVTDAPGLETVDIGDLLRRLAKICLPMESCFHEIV
ncbi:MAG: GNAT family N-acetyltransferase [Eubacteriales bacterium]|nr:GNAT family N-acetyltransferase [Eubacteriales bacterium]